MFESAARPFVGRCDGLPAMHLAEFDDSSREIKNRTFRKHLGEELYLEFERGLGYGNWLRMANDYAVSYVKGKWQGKPAICCFWSSWHHIWLLKE